MDLSKINLLDIQSSSGKTKFYKREVLDIYYKCIVNSKSWDLGLGYFRLSALRLLAYPLSKFILKNNGKIRLYCNEKLSEIDYQILTSNKCITNFEFFKDLNNLREVLSGEDYELFAYCISFLIYEEKIEVKVLIRKEGGRGISHHKNSVFKDTVGNTVVLSGSANNSEQAFLFNREDTNAFCSFWEEKSVDLTIRDTEKEFESTFNSGDDEWEILEINSKELKEKLNEIGFDKIDKTQLEASSKKYGIQNYQHFSEDITKEIEEELSIEANEPHFPKFGEPFPQKPRGYQKKAYQNWKGNGYKGIFAMATGTGKTLTSLNAVLEDYKIKGYYNVIILVPTQILVNQWIKECKKFNFKNIFSTYDYDWADKVKDIQLEKRLGINSNFIFISTYASYNGKKFQDVFKNFKCDETILIADEVHNLGTKKSIGNYLLGINKRIGLSATPNRNFDESGTVEIEKYFNSFSPNHTFSYSMLKAIKSGFLTPYYYYPKFIKLNESEMEAYAKYSEKLLKFFDFEKGTYKEEASNLLIQRKRIIHQATNKKNKLIEILNSINNEDFKHTIVYVPEGFEPDYSISDVSISDDDDLRIIDDYNTTIKDLGIKTHQIIGGMNMDERENILKQFNNGIIQVLTAMKTLDEGVDIPATKCAIFCASTGNPRQFIQRRGRILRKFDGKDFATVYDLIVEPNDISYWNYYPKDKSEKLHKMEINIFRNELYRVANFLYASENLSDLHLKRNTDISKLIDLTEIYKLDLFSEINKLIELDKK